MTQNILVTGAAGFLGARLVADLKNAPGVNIAATYRTPPCPAQIADITVQADLCDREAVERLFAECKFDVVVHVAAVMGRGNDPAFVRTMVDDNIVALSNIYSAALANGCKRFIFCSSISVYDGTEPRDRYGWREDDPIRPASLYGWSKSAGEDLLRLGLSEFPAIRTVSLRFAGIHGPGKAAGIVYNTVLAALHNEPLKINDTESRFRIVFVNDAVEAMKAAIFNGPKRGYDCYNVAGEEQFTLPQFAKMFSRVVGSEIKIQVSAGGPAHHRVMNITKIKTELDFRPERIEHHLRNTFDQMTAAQVGRE